MRILTIIALLASSTLLAMGSYESRTQHPTGQFPIPPNHPFLRTATDQNFRELLVESTMPVLVSFYKNGDRLSQSVAKGFEQTTLALRPFVDVFVMDGELEGAQNLLSTYGITTLPVILHFNSDLHPIPQAANQWAKLPDGYQGDGSAGSLVRWSLGKLSHTNIERVTDDHTLSYFLGVHDHLAYPKVLLVTNDPLNSTAPMFLSMAQRMRKAAVFGVAHNCQAVIDRYHITTFPTVLGFVPEESMGDFTLTTMPPLPSESLPPPEVSEEQPQLTPSEAEALAKKKKDDARNERRNDRLRKRGADGVDDASSAEVSADSKIPNLLYGDVEYEVALADYKHMEAWINTFGIPEEKRQQYGMLIATEEDKARTKAEDMAKWASATEPKILTKKSEWNANCLKMKNKGVCIVIFRDMSDFSGPDAASRLSLDLYRNISRKAAMKSQTPLQICVADGTTNYKLINALGISNGVPDMVAIWPAKNKFYNFLGAINERNILNLFLDKAVKDKGGKTLPEELPKFRKTKVAAAEATEGDDEEGFERVDASKDLPSGHGGDDDEISDEL
eukprot:GILI01013699.1.p1 GENE.GILI01013699.1~~GILI01013699.1.p1  ORF type:complete len:588 (-),score=143.40 GILI01013699.1:135-1817(-)